MMGCPEPVCIPESKLVSRVHRPHQNTWQKDNNGAEDQSLLIFMNPFIVDDSGEIQMRCSFVIEFIIPKFIEGSTCLERHTVHHQEL
jgi:hypothetical protein